MSARPQHVDFSGLYGHWLENACLALAWNAGQPVAYWREEPLDVDIMVRSTKPEA